MEMEKITVDPKFLNWNEKYERSFPWIYHQNVTYTRTILANLTNIEVESCNKDILSVGYSLPPSTYEPITTLMKDTHKTMKMRVHSNYISSFKRDPTS